MFKKSQISDSSPVRLRILLSVISRVLATRKTPSVFELLNKSTKSFDREFPHTQITGNSVCRRKRNGCHGKCPFTDSPPTSPRVSYIVQSALTPVRSLWSALPVSLYGSCFNCLQLSRHTGISSGISSGVPHSVIAPVPVS